MPLSVGTATTCGDLKLTQTQIAVRLRKMPVLSKEERERAIGMLVAGRRPQDVARAFHVHQSTIYRLATRFRRTGSTADAPRPGRPSVLTARTQRHVTRSFRNDPFQSASVAARHTMGTGNRLVSPQTIIRLLRRHRLFCHRPFRGQKLTPQHQQRRLNWAVAHRNWVGEWDDVLFSDECRFCIDNVNNGDRVWRQRGQRYAAINIKEHNFWGGPSVMLWGGLSGNQLVGPIFFQLHPGRGGGVTAARYIAQVLQPAVVPFFARGRAQVFQQDNARPHTALATQRYLQRNNIATMLWPAVSPDLNPMEQVWAYLKRKINTLPRRPATAHELRREIVRQWNRVPAAFLQRLVASMRNRSRLVINNGGGHTRY